MHGIPQFRAAARIGRVVATSTPTGLAALRSGLERWGASPVLRSAAVALTTVLLVPTVVLAQSPWERAAGNLQATFTGPLARSLALVAIVIGGLMFMFGESGAKRQITGIVFGGGLALFATHS